MTVLVAINTRDAMVLAADSQGTVTRPIFDPKDLSGYFDADNGMKLRTGSDGRPLLDTWSQLAGHTLELPYKVHYNVEKLFALDPLTMGVMASGVASIGDRTIKSLINEFKTTPEFIEISENEYTLEQTATKLLEFLRDKYTEVYTSHQGPDMELMLCGYEKTRYISGVVRIYIHRNLVTPPDYDFCIFFGGITREIQRMLFGIDAVNKTRLIKRSEQTLHAYREHIKRRLEEQKIQTELPMPEEFGDELTLFHNVDLGSLQMNCATYSEQDAQDCAAFLVNVMINSQKFSNQIPSTGGDVQIAIIRKHTGFQLVTPR